MYFLSHFLGFVCLVELMPFSNVAYVAAYFRPVVFHSGALIIFLPLCHPASSISKQHSTCV